VQQGLDDRANSLALPEENLKEKDASLDKRTVDLSWWEKDLAFREKMLKRRVGVLGPTAHPRLPLKVFLGVGRCRRL
jgi:hypothetical protein